MTSVYTATYLVHRDLEVPSGAGAAAHAFFEARKASGPESFPYDGADDPAFFSAKHFNGPVTWGVCRTDVRNAVKTGDWVVFVAGERHPGGMDYDYRLVAVLRVGEKHSGWDIPEVFGAYLNRLVSREASRFVHMEPARAKRDGHQDWLWRLCAGPGGRKPLFELSGKDDVVPEAYLGTADADGKNYVAFERDTGFVLERPPLVATKRGAEQLQEQWLQTPEVLALRRVVFGASAERFLRTTNHQQPHRHTRQDVADDETWYDSVRRAAAALA